MIRRFRTLIVSSGLVFALAWPGPAQTSGSAPAPDGRASAYYNFAMGHMYSELAANYGYRSEYVDKAIEHYRAALKSDPGAGLVSEELTDLYIQAGKLADAVAEAEEMLKRNPDNLEARRMLGRIYSRLIQDPQQNRINQERLRQAIEQYRKITEKDGKDLDAWLVLGRLYKIGQDSVESEKAYKKALELDPDNEYALSGMVMVYSDLGDAKNAVEMSRRLAERNPNSRTLRALAKAYEDLHDYAGAVQTLRRALELAPHDLEIGRNLADDLLMAGDIEAALKLYGELAQADPKDPVPQLRLSQIYRQKRDFAKAREAQDRALALDPDSLDIRYNEVNLLDAEGKYADAITRLKQILDSTTKRAYTHSEQGNRALLLERLGLLYRSSEQWALAVETFQQIAALDPDAGPRAAAQVLDTYRQAKEFAKAEKEAEAAYKKYPDDRTVRVIRASLLADLGRTEEAAAAAKQLLDGKRDRETYLALAQIYDKGKKFPEMAQALDAAAKLSESNEEKAEVFFMRGAMHEKMQKLDLAEAEFRKVLEINPQYASALNYLGYMLADRNLRLAEARELIRRAVELEPANGAFLDSLGWVEFRLGKLDDAETYLRQALERVSRDPTVRDHLGDVYFQKGRLKDAIAQWEVSLREWQSSSRAEMDPVEMSKVQKKLEGARVRLAKEAGAVPAPRR
ncbi:MAG: tetratricopeptide repeat protein [Bryobacteraceae bacterium]|jgi:tetratricopeptide (TPR) repeat protein